MPEGTEQAAASSPAPASPAAPAAYDGLPAQVRQALADIPDVPAPDQPKGPPATEPKPGAGQEGQQTEQPSQEGAEPAKTEQQQNAITAEAIKAALESGSLSVDDLIKTPGIDGRVGAMLQRLRDKERQDEAAKAEQARKYQLAESDPEHPLSQELLREKQQLEASGAVAAMENQVFGRLVGSLGTWVGEKLPKELVDEYREKVAGQPTTLPDLVERISDLRLEHFKKTDLPKLVQAELEAKWKDYQAERLGGEPSPEATPATRGGVKQLTQRDIDAMDWREYAKVEKEILAGRIKLAAA